MEIEIIISELDFYLIEKVRELRIKSEPYLDQVTLAQRIGVSEGYIGRIENPKIQSKYNIRMLNRVSKALGLNSYDLLFPSKLLSNDLVKIRLKLKKQTKRKHEIDGAGNVVKRFDILSIKPLSENEQKRWDAKDKKNKLDYLRIL
ncbi:helix-turn-helix transcriptional regulator [Salegentibacter mishustinae]|jgi:transcriptional regulator with XRE-family HTH domain|uniref:helix-turn-helix domain-containing protein n=1 Tax=Salegentibacter mishustinae TaxID=270918 RepID=UPI001CE12EC3|nr:helix-turn-helix transcriptional regulator [Salegentibacter mishustinae]UBZ08635.1 helix-turn-helix transcriptional regulator [Salegentibacter mishustinae]|tara:strand:+ start:953 stop:1390 length:438 start_codon:yes stop_codon:yes gene_type:complete